MTSTPLREDAAPWYRQFWPWFLICLPACVVVAGLSTLYIANRGADDLVVDEYYKDGLAINRELAKIKRAQSLGIAAKLEIRDGRLNVLLDGQVSDAELPLKLSHPMEADKDMVVTLQRVSSGFYTAPLPNRIEPRWHWVLETEGESGWRVDGVLQAADFPDARPH